MKLLVASLAIAAARVAHADQCASPSSEMAARARQLIADHPKVISFCEPCGDRVPGEPQELASASSGPGEVRFNGVAIDLAYTYVQTSPRRYDNLAVLVGCPTVGVSPSLRVEDAADRGVLILPDSSEPAPVPQVAVAQLPAPVPLAPTIIVQPAVTSGLGWWAIASGCGATSGLWIVALRMRRRRAHRPRLG